MLFLLRIWKDIYTKKRRTAQDTGFQNSTRNWILVVLNVFFFLLEHTSGDDNDPSLKSRNCGLFEELKRERERERERWEREREREREREKGREGG